MFLIPGTSHAITWSKQSLQDDTTYYVRAVIRDVRTEAILDTIDLTDLGNGRFHEYWNVVQDPSGRGRQIEIEKTIYENSGYTQVSPIYGRWLDRYIVYDLNRATSTGGHSTGGNSVDYDRIEKMLEKAVAAALTGKGNHGESFAAVLAGITALQDALGEHGITAEQLTEKAGTLSDAEEKILAAATKLEETVQSFTDSVGGTLDGAATRLQQLLAAEMDPFTEKIAAALKNGELNISQKTDAELEHVVSQFKKIMEDAANNFATKIGTGIDEQLAKPVRVQSVQDYNVVRDGDEQKPAAAENGNDLRVQRLMRPGMKS